MEDGQGVGLEEWLRLVLALGPYRCLIVFLLSLVGINATSDPVIMSPWETRTPGLELDFDGDGISATSDAGDGSISASLSSGCMTRLTWLCL